MELKDKILKEVNKRLKSFIGLPITLSSKDKIIEDMHRTIQETYEEEGVGHFKLEDFFEIKISGEKLMSEGVIEINLESINK